MYKSNSFGMIVVLIFLFSLTQSYCFNERDIEIISTLNQHFVIKQSILVSTKQDEVISISRSLKNLSGRNIYAVYLNLPRLSRYLLKENLLNFKVVIVLKANNNSELKYILEELKSKVFYNGVFPKFTWILMLPNNSDDITEKNFHVPFDCEFFLIRETESNFTVTEIYQIKKDSKMIHSHFGRFSNKFDFKFHDKSIYQRRNNLQGKIMNMEIQNQGICHYLGECFLYEIWTDLGKMFNFTTKTIKQKDIKLNSSIIQDVSNIAEIFHSITHNKDKLLGPLLRAKSHVYIRDTGNLEKIWNVYFKPFEQDLWIAVAFWISISIVIFTTIGWFSSKLLDLKGYHLIDYGLESLSALYNQSLNENPKNISSRIAKMAAFIAAGFLLPAYSAFIISFLTVNRPVLPFTDFEFFVEDGTYKLTSCHFKFTITFFNETNDPTIRKIRGEFLVDYNDWARSHREAIDMICSQQKLAVLNYNYMMLRKWSPCKIVIAFPTKVPIVSAIKLGEEAVQYKKSFLESIAQYRSAGFISNMEKKKLGFVDTAEIKTFETIDISTTKSLIVLLMSGIIISIILFFAEKLLYSVKRQHNKSFLFRKKRIKNVI